MNFLPILFNLPYKRLTVEAIYPRCKRELETREHVFWDCPVTKETWDKLQYVWSQELINLEYVEWFTWALMHNSSNWYPTFACVLWAIWIERNKWVHEGQKNQGQVQQISS